MKAFVCIMLMFFLGFLPALVFSKNTLDEKEDAVLESAKEKPSDSTTNPTGNSFSLTKVPKAERGTDTAYANDYDKSARTSGKKITQPLADRNPFRETDQECVECEIEEDEGLTVVTPTQVYHPPGRTTKTVTVNEECDDDDEDDEECVETERKLPATGQMENAVYSAITTGLTIVGYFYIKSRRSLKEKLLSP